MELYPPQAYPKYRINAATSWLKTLPQWAQDQVSNINELMALHKKSQAAGGPDEVLSILSQKAGCDQIKSQPEEPFLKSSLKTKEEPVEPALENLELSFENEVKTLPQSKETKKDTPRLELDFKSNEVKKDTLRLELDFKSNESLEKIQKELNLSSKQEALRAAIAVGYKTLFERQSK